MKIGLLRFRNIHEKAAYLEEGARKDANLPSVMSWRDQFMGVADEPERARAILRFVTHCIDYVNDPHMEILDDSGVALFRGHGDCDVKSRVFVALCNICGIPARTKPKFKNGGFPHIQAEVFLHGRWWLVDPIVVNSDVGFVPPAYQSRTSWR